MNIYQKTLNFLYSQLPMFHRIGIAAYRPNLKSTKLLLDAVGNPHKNFKSIHIAGTNGKGSSSHMLAAILQTAGYKTGLYTSPHMKDFRERVKINGHMIGKMYVVDWVKQHRRIIKKIQPSFFEMTVALAFNYFSDEEVDIAVIETGLGGRLDSTNVIHPLVSLITNIGMDHTEILGDTLEKIATEKAGIIKRWAPAVISETNPETQKVFREIAKKRLTQCYFADQIFEVKNIFPPLDPRSNIRMDITTGDATVYRLLETDLTANYQTKNILGVLETIEALKEKGYEITEQNIREGLKNVKHLTGLIGRWQLLSESPLTICDVAHNAHGIAELMKQVSLTHHYNLHFVFGVVKDKDISKVLELLPKDAIYYFCKADLPRALDATELQTKAAEFNLKGAIYPSVKDALEAAQNAAQYEDLVLVAGSTFVVAEVV
jgi:dihydrofolate synthase / folylpolyglutamate synthase